MTEARKHWERTMMKCILTACLTVVCSLAHAATAQESQVVGAFIADAPPRDGFARLKLSLSIDTSGTEEVRVAGVALCSASVCFEGSVPSTVTVSGTAAGTSTAIADLEVPYADIESIRFKTVAGAGIVVGSIQLPEPLELQPPLRAGEIMVVLQRRDAGTPGYVPMAAASSLLRKDGVAIHYNPSTKTTVELPFGTQVVIPANAYPRPQIFNAALHDTGDDYPLLDIYPDVNFERGVSISFTPVGRPPRALYPGQSPSTPKPMPAFALGAVAPDTAKLVRRMIEVRRGGVIRGTANAQGESHMSAEACNPAGWCDCAAALAHPPNQQIISDGLLPTGTEYLDWCTTIAPYIHISVSDLTDPRERFTIRHDPEIQIHGVSRLPLQRITTWSQYAQAMLNGFTWDGDPGIGPGSYGMAKGFVASSPSNLGTNMVGGGNCDDRPNEPNCWLTSQADNTKYVMQILSPNNQIAWWHQSGRGMYFAPQYVSSSTSILVNGQCTGDSEVNRWSAVGTTPSGRLVFVSSTSDGQTTSAQLCPVFLALGVTNAIRLDGGSSAALTVDGQLKNPLTGFNSFVFGFARHIPYALKVAYPGW